MPLSEGRIETDGTLQCAYHGWRFNAEGACTTIPQAESPEAQRKSAGHPRACVASYPVQVISYPTASRLRWDPKALHTYSKVESQTDSQASQYGHMLAPMLS